MTHDAGTPIVVHTTEDLGALVRLRREQKGLPLRQAAPLSNVGTRFLSEFERGKPTVALGKVVDTLHGLGLDLAVIPRTAPETVPERTLSEVVGTEFPYDWSNARMGRSTFIRKVLLSHRFPDVLRSVACFGFDQVAREVAYLDRPEAVERAADVLARILKGKLLAEANHGRGESGVSRSDRPAPAHGTNAADGTTS